MAYEMHAFKDEKLLRTKAAGVREQSEFVAAMAIDHRGMTAQTRKHLKKLQDMVDDGKIIPVATKVVHDG